MTNRDRIEDYRPSGTEQDQTAGVWLVVGPYEKVRVFLTEIDALRYVNGATKTSGDSDTTAYFIPDGSSLDEVRGY